jgi:hypothetical protein
VVYAYPNEDLTSPALVLVPGNPYIEPVGIGGLTNRINVGFDLTAVVGASDNQASLANIETLMLEVLQVLPAGYSVTAWNQPTVLTDTTAGAVVTASIRIQTTTTLGD